MANDTMPIAAAGENQLHSLWAENARLRQTVRRTLAAWLRWVGCGDEVLRLDFLDEMERLRELTT